MRAFGEMDTTNWLRRLIRIRRKRGIRIIRAVNRLLLLIVIFTLCFSQSAKAERQQYIWENDWRIPIPTSYRNVKVITYLGEKSGFLNGAEDLFIDKNDCMYVADTLNNRVLKLTLEGETLEVFTGPSEKPLKNPKGIYVDDDGHMFIADTGNLRIIHLSRKGEFIEEFIKPESNLLSEDFTFDPSKVYINSTGYIFIIKSQAFFSMGANNEFQGYIGSTKVGFDFQRILINMFASDFQKSQVIKKLPDSYSNFVIDDYGMIYATVINAKRGQIRKITSAGKNIYPGKFYGEITRSGWRSKIPNFVDIAVDKNGIVSVVDQASGKIYQYDQEGNMLAAFGGLGNQKGTFKIPSSIVLDSQGRLYVLDQKANNIQIFEPTNFINLVHEASRLYNDGRYAESRDVWEKVLQIDGKYALAHRGIAKALIKEEKWIESMETYKLANDQEGYSEAFIQYRHSIYRRYFGWIILLIAVVIVVLFYMLKYLKKLSESVLRKHMGW
ncbi:MAG TPA: NHL repeat-containing protein [Clostridiales bacterium]|nr:NHL repeat-containing protein [Clostridiales bacterium]